MNSPLLGDTVAAKFSFQGLQTALQQCTTAEFQKLPLHQKKDKIGKLLLGLIDNAPKGRFLLTAVMEFIENLHETKAVDSYVFSTFELWLNHASGLTLEENLQVRGKIAGRLVPRDEYQVLFPIGMGKSYPGSHFVTAHSSPDLDTTVASFWGWVDAFAAKVSDGMHLWNVPGGAPAATEISLLFYARFGERVFQLLAKDRTHLSVSGLDLAAHTGFAKKRESDSTLSLDLEKTHPAVVMVDEHGSYLGDWRSSDVENVRFVITLLNQCLRWYENHLHVRLVSFFGKEELRLDDLSRFLQEIFNFRIGDCEPVKEFTKKHIQLVEDYLVKVLFVKEGLGATFESFAHAMKMLGLHDFQAFVDLMEDLKTSHLFDSSGKIKEARPHIFTHLAKIVEALDKAIYSIRLYVENLGVALKVKSQVLGIGPHTVSYRADLDEVRSKIDGFSFLTVTESDGAGLQYPVGVVFATELFKTTLGTVTLRDFSNREETKVPPYLEVISVIDHHKSSFTTSAPYVAIISDAQSSNALVASASFAINDSYSTAGMTIKQIEEQMKEVQQNLSSLGQQRILQRLLQKKMAAERIEKYFVSPEREMTEYLHYLYAILDDTDLLTKVSLRDVECVASLLNRLKTLSLQKEVEIIHFDDVPRDAKFAKAAAKRILQNREMHSLYSKVYAAKEKNVEEALQACVAKQPSTVFVDTKVQNGCCRVGQTKLFAKNYPLFARHAMEIRKIWLVDAQETYKAKKEVDLHLHMVSTVAGADELFAGSQGKYPHKDEMWLWIPSTVTAVEHLKTFLNAFRSSPGAAGNEMEVEFLGDNAQELEQIFKESFTPLPCKTTSAGLPIAVLRFTAGTINSRKAMISPYLPLL